MDNKYPDIFLPEFMSLNKGKIEEEEDSEEMEPNRTFHHMYAKSFKSGLLRISESRVEDTFIEHLKANTKVAAPRGILVKQYYTPNSKDDPLHDPVSRECIQVILERLLYVASDENSSVYASFMNQPSSSSMQKAAARCCAVLDSLPLSLVNRPSWYFPMVEQPDESCRVLDSQQERMNATFDFYRQRAVNTLRLDTMNATRMLKQSGLYVVDTLANPRLALTSGYTGGYYDFKGMKDCVCVYDNSKSFLNETLQKFQTQQSRAESKKQINERISKALSKESDHIEQQLTDFSNKLDEIDAKLHDENWAVRRNLQMASIRKCIAASEQEFNLQFREVSAINHPVLRVLVAITGPRDTGTQMVGEDVQLCRFWVLLNPYILLNHLDRPYDSNARIWDSFRRFEYELYEIITQRRLLVDFKNVDCWGPYKPIGIQVTLNFPDNRTVHSHMWQQESIVVNIHQLERGSLSELEEAFKFSHRTSSHPMMFTPRYWSHVILSKISCNRMTFNEQRPDQSTLSKHYKELPNELAIDSRMLCPPEQHEFWWGARDTLHEFTRNKTMVQYSQVDEPPHTKVSQLWQLYRILEDYIVNWAHYQTVCGLACARLFVNHGNIQREVDKQFMKENAYRSEPSEDGIHFRLECPILFQEGITIPAGHSLAFHSHDTNYLQTPFVVEFYNQGMDFRYEHCDKARKSPLVELIFEGASPLSVEVLTFQSFGTINNLRYSTQQIFIKNTASKPYVCDRCVCRITGNGHATCEATDWKVASYSIHQEAYLEPLMSVQVPEKKATSTSQSSELIFGSVPMKKIKINDDDDDDLDNVETPAQKNPFKMPVTNTKGTIKKQEVSVSSTKTRSQSQAEQTMPTQQSQSQSQSQIPPESGPRRKRRGNQFESGNQPKKGSGQFKQNNNAQTNQTTTKRESSDSENSDANY